MSAGLSPTSLSASPRYCLNTSTIRGFGLSILEEIDIAAKAGYQAIEPWVEGIDKYTAEGGSLSDLKKIVLDKGLFVANAIGFFEWIVEDDARRAAGFEEAKRNMDIMNQLGSALIAAPPMGAVDAKRLDLLQVAVRYRELCELGDEMGVSPMVEVWGFSKTLDHLGEAALVAIESAHPRACILADVYHLYKGGSDYHGLSMLQPSAFPLMHMNDYPAGYPAATITDADRVYPGDGIAPLTDILQTLDGIGFDGILSLELFNESYWKTDPLSVATIGLMKTKAAVLAAFCK